LWFYWKEPANHKINTVFSAQATYNNTAVTKLHASRPQKDLTPPPPFPHSSKLMEQHCQLWYTAWLNFLLLSGWHNLPWKYCAVNFNLFVFHKFVIPDVLCIKMLCGDAEDQPETSSTVITSVKLDSLTKFAIRNQYRRTIYNVNNFFQKHFWTTWIFQ
jgi:hypothetical protein